MVTIFYVTVDGGVDGEVEGCVIDENIMDLGGGNGMGRGKSEISSEKLKVSQTKLEKPLTIIDSDGGNIALGYK